MSKVERRFVSNEACPVEVEMRDDGKPSKIHGYAAVFYVEDDETTQYQLWPGVVERIMPRAFNRALKDKDDVRGLFNHNPDQVLGRTSAKTMKLTKDTRGLRYEIDPPNTTIGMDTAESINRGDVSGSSFSFTVDDDGQKWVRKMNDDGSSVDIREIHSVKMLYDVGPVTFPAYSGTTTGLRSENLSELRSSYDSWRQSEESAVNEAAQEAQRQADVAAKLEAYRQRAEQVT